MASEPRRLHPLSWLFITAKSVKGLIFPALLLLFASRNNPWARYELLGAVFVIPTLIGALIQQRIYNYRFGDAELIVRHGLLTRKERHIPYDRIHNIAMVRNPFHRLLGVASARVETAGGGEPEAVMRVLPLAAVDELRRRTMGDRDSAGEGAVGGDDETEGAAPAAAAAAGDLILALPVREIVKLGLISRRGLIVFSAAAGLLWQVGARDLDFQRLPGRLAGDLPGWLTSFAETAPTAVRALLGAGLVLGFFALLLALSVVWNLVKYHDFTLRRERGDLRTDFGLWTRVSSLIPVRRIQWVSAHASILHRWLDRASIDLETAGASEEGSDLERELARSGVNVSAQYLAPILERARVPELVRQVLPAIDLEAVAWQSLSAKARWRIMKRLGRVTAFFTLVAAIVLGVLVGPLAALHALWLPAVLLPLAFLRVSGWLRHSAWGVSESAVFFRSGWLARSVSAVPLDKVQTVTMTASFFDRRHDMASVAVDTAGAGATGLRIDVPYLDREVAESLCRRLYGEAAATEFDW